MPDVFSKAKRSEVMSRIRGRGNKETELALVALFRLHRITGWRRHLPLIGRPDFVFPAVKLAIFVDGCFWHGCPKHSNMPANNRAFWQKKLTGNKARDRIVTRVLRSRGWRVIRIWEHELRKSDRVLMRISRPWKGSSGRKKHESNRLFHILGVRKNKGRWKRGHSLARSA